jgi:hypothetical protein
MGRVIRMPGASPPFPTKTQMTNLLAREMRAEHSSARAAAVGAESSSGQPVSHAGGGASAGEPESESVFNAAAAVVHGNSVRG